MDCSAVRGLINRYIDGELGYVETAEFQQHLDFCPDCSAELRELSGLRATLAALGEARLEAPPGFAGRVMASVASQPPPGAPRPLGAVLEDTLEALDCALGRVRLPGGRTIPVKNVLGWGLALAALVIGVRRRSAGEREAAAR